MHRPSNSVSSLTHTSKLIPTKNRQEAQMQPMDEISLEEYLQDFEDGVNHKIAIGMKKAVRLIVC